MNFQYKDLYIKLGLNITYYRKANSMTQDALAEKIGIDRTHIGKFETARSGVSLDVLFAIAEALDTPIYKFFEFRD